MLQSIRQSTALPRLPVAPLAVAATLFTFGWLLAHDLIHPLVILLLQLYLVF